MKDFETVRGALDDLESYSGDQGRTFNCANERAALDRIEVDLADARHERDLACEARDNWRKASDEKLTEAERLRAENRQLKFESVALESRAREEFDKLRGENPTLDQYVKEIERLRTALEQIVEAYEYPYDASRLLHIARRALNGTIVEPEDEEEEP